MKYFRVLAVVAIVLIAGMGLRPLQSGLKESRETLKELQKTKTKKIKELAKLQALAASEETPGQLAQQIPVGRNQAQFLADMVNVLRSSELPVTSISFSESFDSTVGATRLSARFRIEGSLQKLYSFLKAVEALPRFTALDKFDINTQEKNGELSVSLPATLYTFFVLES